MDLPWDSVTCMGMWQIRSCGLEIEPPTAGEDLRNWTGEATSG